MNVPPSVAVSAMQVNKRPTEKPAGPVKPLRTDKLETEKGGLTYIQLFPDGSTKIQETGVKPVDKRRPGGGGTGAKSLAKFSSIENSKIGAFGRIRNEIIEEKAFDNENADPDLVKRISEAYIQKALGAQYDYEQQIIAAGGSVSDEERASNAAEVRKAFAQRIASRRGGAAAAPATPATPVNRPFGSGPASAPKPLDRDTAMKFLQQAGGDKQKARKLAQEAGYR
jgi:hypothetical protein